MTDEQVVDAGAGPIRWSMVAQALTRPYPVSQSMIVLVSLVPFYIFIAEATRNRRLHIPELALDRAIPLQPAWALIYGSFYLFLILLPVFVVCQPEHIRRTVRAYLTVWITAYACFLIYPTVASRPAVVPGANFAAWALRFLYSADPPYNCFPSIHVAHSLVSALTCYRVHRGVGIAALLSAGLVSLSTLFTKQHYALDVVAGIGLAWLAYSLFLHSYPHEPIPKRDHRVAPILAAGLMGGLWLAVAVCWIAYRLMRKG